MHKGQITQTSLGDPIEIKSIDEQNNYAIVYQLDDDNKRIKLYKKQGYLQGRITLRKVELLNL